MIDVPFNELDFGDVSPVNCDINSLQLKDPIMGDKNYFGPFFNECGVGLHPSSKSIMFTCISCLRVIYNDQLIIQTKT